MDKVAVEFTFVPRNNRARANPPGPDPGPASCPDIPPGSIPRVTRLMALAIKFDAMLARGEVRDYADLACLGYVTRARITQIMNLLTLAPDIQEQILSLHRVAAHQHPHGLVTGDGHDHAIRLLCPAHVGDERVPEVVETEAPNPCRTTGPGEGPFDGSPRPVLVEEHEIAVPAPLQVRER
jgi:hypothetical protein